jgi:PAS domain S-box-containing protein
MDFEILITNPFQLVVPSGFFAWIGWFILLSLIIFLNRKWYSFNQPLSTWRKRILVLLSISVPVLTLVFPSLKISSGPFTPALPLFAAVPWFLAAGLLGPASAAALGFLSGVFISQWSIHNPFLPLEMALLASCLGWLFFQEYRTPFYRLFRHPFTAGILFAVAYPVIYSSIILIFTQGSFSFRVEAGLPGILDISILFGTTFLVAGIISEFVSFGLKSHWGAQKSNRPSPGESRLSSRFLYSVVPLSLILLVILMVGDWLVISRAAREMLTGRMSNAGEMTALGIPFFLETGQNLVLRLVDEPEFLGSPDDIKERFSSERRDVPYFNQFIFLDAAGQIVVSDPSDASISTELTSEENEAINLASLVPIQIVPTKPVMDNSAASLSFIAGVKDRSDELRGVLIGRSDLAVNPFAKPLLTGLNSLSAVEGEGMLLDENGMILYHTDPSRVMTFYTEKLNIESEFIETTSEDGIREFVYYQPVAGKPWSVVITVPSRFAQQQALNITLPLLGIISILAILGIFIFRYGLKSIISSLENLATEADRMSQGQLDDPLELGGEDEVGQLRRSFEKMRASLKSRLDELNRLLMVSQGIASTFELQDSLQPILDSALDTGASSARVSLIPSILPSSESGREFKHRFGAGPNTNKYAFLDDQVLALVERQEVLKLSNVTRPRLFSHSQEQLPPQAILGVALRHENLFYGVIWLAYEQSRQFSEEEVRYIVTLAGQAALAAANARLFLSAEIGRQRLESIITSTPDPVIVTDQNDNLLFTNPAGQERFSLYDEQIIGKHISKLITNEAVIQLLHAADTQPKTEELRFEDGNIYVATASIVEVSGERVGRICILRDVSNFKQLDALKSEFVSTVSHDLRSPLALIQGYTSMLKMVGELNEQQISYLNKITAETEKISHLVTNLLDLGRIEAGVGLRLERKPVYDVIEQVVSEIQAKADQKRVLLKTGSETIDLPYFEADQALVQQALYNLVDNAIKFTNPGGEIDISINSTNENVTFIVKDNGIGISPADQQNLFEKFFRATDKGEIDEEGSGLGLAIVKSIAEKHGGVVRVESKLGEGSTFFLTIPLNQEMPVR